MLGRRYAHPYPTSVSVRPASQYEHGRGSGVAFSGRRPLRARHIATSCGSRRMFPNELQSNANPLGRFDQARNLKGAICWGILSSSSESRGTSVLVG